MPNHPIPSKPARGIQYEDVAQAADALLQDGLRPTIERIRQRIGRGSPNTVGPMLEQWFSGLGQRLGGATHPPGQTDTPAAVLQAANALWATALQESLAQAQDACAAQRAALADEAAQLQEASTRLQAQELAWTERLRALEGALQKATEQWHESQQRGQLLQHTLAQREADIAQQRTALADSAQQCAGLQQRLDHMQVQAQQERTALEERWRSSERHWLEELDRARQEIKKTVLIAQDATRKQQALQAELDATRATHHALALEHANQTSALRQELASTQIQAAQAHTLLAQMQNAALQPASTATATARPHAISAARSIPLATRIPRRKLGKNR
ncbi:DNA-binding protein [Simplicispira metamorpha]|uniref:Plasmid replication DNA-binding protein KfrA n=1 Tax=Simplicispira metamorpha TaxID=80881 RepID=A0A4R2N9Q4_9BURK|nr:DNA-binding protein [Simplicispira metamorpha]TCP17750.1 plasmid replication DNA-binding protein KfrA [Simplicispira metamorpha]